MKRGCTQCGECLNVCPVYRRFKREEFSPKGKRALLEPLDSGLSDLSWAEAAKLSRLCAGCGKCALTCARKLSTADLLADVRAKNPHWTQHLWELWIRRLGPLWPSLGRIADLIPDAVTPGALRSSLLTARALVNPPEEEPWARLERDPAFPFTPERVIVFAGCTANNVRPAWREKAVHLLRIWGHEVLDASGFTCCGATMHHAGQYAAMRDMRAANAAHWRALGKPRLAVFCASCFHGLAGYDADALGQDAATWQRSLTPVSALLTGAKAAITSRKPATFGYHQPCHWEQNDPDLPFLQALLPGLVKGAGLCCGMGGILKMTDPDLSLRMAEDCLTAFAPGERILTGCSGCVLQLSSLREPGEVRHWLDVMETMRA